MAITADPDATLEIAGPERVSRFVYADDFMAWTKRVVPQVQISNSELVFVGYGIVAPEYDWNDYEGVDVRGKTVVILVNDPGFGSQDPALFNGNSMTYYGRWTYKFEEAARQGAAGAFVVHETEAAAYPWEVVTGSWSGPQFELIAEDDNMARAAVEGWFTLETARTVFSDAGLDYDSLKILAEQTGFEPVLMGITASLALSNIVQRSVSHNVIGLLPGVRRSDEYIVYMAHWDHLGRDPSLDGDQIYNGALDNATGTAGLLELAEAFVSLEERPDRSILFLAAAAEEQGLLGSAYYGSHPVYALEKTVAVFNMDGANVWGPMNDITVIGYGNSELDDYVVQAAAMQGRTVSPDPEPEKGYYYRSDHFSLAKEGVPALYIEPGIDHVEHGEEWTLERRDEYTNQRYHKPSDEYDPNWDLSGAVDDLRLIFRVGYRLAGESQFPNWHEGNEFRIRRDAMMAAAP